jgi:hypothetical protein
MLFLRSILFGAALLLPTLSSAEDMAPAALNSFSSAPAALSSAQLLDQNGHVLGKVEKVQTDQDGRPSAVSFRVASTGRIVVVPASEVSYDGKVLITSSDQPQIAELSGTPTRTARAN